MAAASIASIAYMPVILPISVAMLVWAKLFDYRFGYLNVLLQDVGVAKPAQLARLAEHRALCHGASPRSGRALAVGRCSF